jgi:hypothetical protein
VTPPVSAVETFDERWARWQAKAAVQDRFWRRATIATGLAIGAGALAWLAAALLGF